MGNLDHGLADLYRCIDRKLLRPSFSHSEASMWILFYTTTFITYQAYLLFLDLLIGASRISPTRMIFIFGLCSTVESGDVTGEQPWL